MVGHDVHTPPAFHILPETSRPDCSPSQTQPREARAPTPPNPTRKSTAHAPIPSLQIDSDPMGWRWHDDGDDGGRGLGDIPDLAGGGGGGDGERCATRRVVQSRCHTKEVEPGRFVRKCEKTEQLLRDCVGRYIHILHGLALFPDLFLLFLRGSPLCILLFVVLVMNW